MNTYTHIMQDATPILRSTCIKSISDSEIHVSLDNMAVDYQENNLLD